MGFHALTLDHPSWCSPVDCLITAGTGDAHLSRTTRGPILVR